MRKNAFLSWAMLLALAPAWSAHGQSIDYGAPATDAVAPIVRDGSPLGGISPTGGVPFHVFTANSGERYYNIAVSQQGNLTRYVSPIDFNMLWWEGYIACSTNAADVVASAYEYGSEVSDANTSALWGAAIATDLTPLTIERTTTDGRLYLKQKFQADKNEMDLTITMVLKNVSGGPLTNVRLERHADIDVDITGVAWTDDWASRDGIRTYIFDNRGVALDAMSSIGTVTTYLDYPAVPTTFCGGVGGDAGPVGPGRRNMRVSYYFGTLSNGESKTVKFRYSRL